MWLLVLLHFCFVKNSWLLVLLHLCFIKKFKIKSFSAITSVLILALNTWSLSQTKKMFCNKPKPKGFIHIHLPSLKASLIQYILLSFSSFVAQTTQFHVGDQYLWCVVRHHLWATFSWVCLRGTEKWQDWKRGNRFTSVNCGCDAHNSGQNRSPKQFWCSWHHGCDTCRFVFELLTFLPTSEWIYNVQAVCEFRHNRHAWAHMELDREARPRIDINSSYRPKLCLTRSILADTDLQSRIRVKS